MPETLEENQSNHTISPIKIFPNPATNTLHIDGLNISESLCDISITDMLGRNIMEVKQHDANKELDISLLHSGVYCLIIKNTNLNNKFIFYKQ